MAVHEPWVLASGYVPAAIGTVYTAPPGKKTFITALRIFNFTPGIEIFELHLNLDGTDRWVARVRLKECWHANVIEHRERFTMDAGDIVKLRTTSANAVNYVLMGVERT